MPRWRRADRALQAADPVLGVWVERYGPCPLRRRQGHPNESVVKAVVSQLISTQAAATITARLQETLGALTPPEVAGAGVERLRELGLNTTKARALVTLAERQQAGTLDLSALFRRPSAEIHRRLEEVPGIGPWTVHMLLIFHLARPDVFPNRDLGIQEGIKRLDQLDRRPTPAEAARRAACWAPYRSTASWYLWRSKEDPAQSTE